MKFLSLKPFVPSGRDFERSRELFQEMGFTMTWSDDSYADFDRDGCGFILQRFENRDFAENFMVAVQVSDVDAFRNKVIESRLPEKFGIRIGEACLQPYGKEVNVIDIAGVCWHFVQPILRK